MRKERADRERRLEALAVAVLTPLGERDALIRDAEQRAGQALRTMTEDEGLSLRESAEWCGSGVTLREITRLLRLDRSHQVVETDGSDELIGHSAGVRSKLMRLPGLSVCGGRAAAIGGKAEVVNESGSAVMPRT
jgi:hypothetical protein